jgi:hypothetical protein
LFLFTDAINEKRGQRLAAYVRKHKLGKITASPVGYNPQHDSRVQGWFWLVDFPAIARWSKARVDWSYAERNLHW